MNKPIFENEEEAREYNDIMEKCCHETKNCDLDNCSKCRVNFTKENGFIKQSELEKARENYYKMFEKIKKTILAGSMWPEYKIYINELEKDRMQLLEEIERLKK